MARPNPREVFDDPASHWSFLTTPRDDDFEGKHFDRKQAGQIQAGGGIDKKELDNVRKLVTKTASAFANSNQQGGLLVLGITSSGQVEGVDHLSETELNSITDIGSLLRCQRADVSYFPCTDRNGNSNNLCLIFSGWSTTGICETHGTPPDAWVRNGTQSVPVKTDEMRENLRLQKGLVNFENDPVCEFDADDVDHDVLAEFRKVFCTDAGDHFDDVRLLKEAGAIVSRNGNWWFTAPGVLFFSANPQRVYPYAHIRLLRFGVPASDHKNRGKHTFEKEFKGPLASQIRATRSFFRESGFFKRFDIRRPEGGFVEEPELPPVAVDEAIVNAVAHRDYRRNTPIECEAYLDAFVVKNAGRIVQRDLDLPDDFQLDRQSLDSTPVNSKLLSWLKLMRDPDGKAFVLAISEGTKTMTREMQALKLPAPFVHLTKSETIVRLQSNAQQREAAILAASQTKATETLNHYPLHIRRGTENVPAFEFRQRSGEFMNTVRDALDAQGWYIDRSSFSRITCHRKGNELPLIREAHAFVRLYPAYTIQHAESFGTHSLSVDYRCEVLNVAKLNKVLNHLPLSEIVGRTCTANASGWRKGRIIAIDADWTTVQFFDTESEERVATSEVIPNLSLGQIEILLQAEKIIVDLHAAIKRASLASEKAAARMRAEKIQQFVADIAAHVFPIAFGEYGVSLCSSPVELREQGRNGTSLAVYRLNEPHVLFRDRNASSDVREGLTKFGSFDNDEHAIEIIPLCIDHFRSGMEGLIHRLMEGKFKYRGSERTFSTRFSYRSILNATSARDLDGETERLLKQNPDWIGDRKLNRIFLVQSPEAGYSSDDESSPYYVIKRRLLEAGIPCQMVDSPTISNPDWKDLNLALNITAKCGITPWVLPDRIPDADFFIGLSYTESRDGTRIMGFANVFNNYGRWVFYTGNTSTFEVSERSRHLSVLAKGTLERLKQAHSLPSSASLVIHHSVRIAKEDRTAILKAVREVAPDSTVTFVWINSHGNSRMFDTKPETDGSLRRGSYVPLSRQRILLSTTGSNPYRKAMGTPHPLELTALHFAAKDDAPSDYDQRSLVMQVLSLTKLNWASTDSFCGEPITIKYASDIAYLTAAFLRQREPFKLHPTLEATPWFI